MTKADLAAFKGRLEAAKAALEQSLRCRDGVSVERTPDASDEAQYAFYQDLMARTLDRESYSLAGIRLALRKIDEGDYGMCEDCDHDIGAKRLAALPWARYCIRCQEALDQAQEHPFIWAGDLSRAA